MERALALSFRPFQAFADCYGLNCVPTKDTLLSPHPPYLNVTFLGNRVLAGLTELR